MVRCAFPAHLLTIMTIAALATPGNGGKRPACSFGTEPGVWRGHNYETLNSDCRLVRYVDHITNKTSQKEVSGEVLFVGDSLNRNLIMDAAGLFGAPVSNYTPVAYDDRGLPEKIGRNEMLRLGSLVMANIFHFGAHERETHWLGPARAGIAGMHNTTYGRVCLDAPRYLKLAGIHKVPRHTYAHAAAAPRKEHSLSPRCVLLPFSPLCSYSCSSSTPSLPPFPPFLPPLPLSLSLSLSLLLLRHYSSSLNRNLGPPEQVNKGERRRIPTNLMNRQQRC